MRKNKEWNPSQGWAGRWAAVPGLGIPEKSRGVQGGEEGHKAGVQPLHHQRVLVCLAEGDYPPHSQQLQFCSAEEPSE